MVPKAVNFFGHTFNAEIGLTQGDPVSPTIFIIVVDSVVRAVLLKVCVPQEAQHVFGWAAGEHNICFYAYDGWISGRNPIWVQTALTAMVRIFERVVLHTNLSKNNSMVCIPGFIWGHQGFEAYNWRDTGEGPTFWERKGTRVILK